MRALRKNLTVRNELVTGENFTRVAAIKAYPALAAVTPAATLVAAAPAAVAGNEGGLKQVALLVAAPFIGLACVAVGSPAGARLLRRVELRVPVR